MQFKLPILIIIFVASTIALCAQDDEDFQSWNDFQITVPLSSQVDYFNKVTMRFGKNVTRLNDGRFAVGVVWKPTKYLSISPYYWYVRARNAAEKFRAENRLAVAATYKFPFNKFGLSHRSNYEYRSRTPVSWRYRAMLPVDKDIPEKIIPKARWFVSDEVFYDSATDKFSRNRFSISITKIISKNLSLDIYYTRQNDGYAHPGDLNIIWTAWKIKL